MKVLVTGHNGYIGSIMCPLLAEAGHEVVGLDSFLFRDCTLLPGNGFDPPAIDIDIRDVEVHHLEGFDAVIHLAGISNDPLGDLSPAVTDEINNVASVRLSRLAKQAGITRFLFSSTCSVYGASSPNDILDETAPFKPLTPYGVSKMDAEAGIRMLADDDFSPSFLRSGTAYGASPRLRGDLVVNNLVGYAVTTKSVLMKSDGTPWRPLVHVEDIARAFLATLDAPREAVHNEAFNVGDSAENYRVRDVAHMVADAVPESEVEFAEGSGPDLRCYRVTCDKLASRTSFSATWSVMRGIEQVRDAYLASSITLEEFTSSRLLRIKKVLELQAQGAIDDSLRWRESAAQESR